MFTIEGDLILVRGVPFATIDGRAWPTLRAEAAEELTHGSTEWVAWQEHTAEVDRIETESYDNGYAEGFAAAKAAALRIVDDMDMDAAYAAIDNLTHA